MTPEARFRIIFAPEVITHLQAIDRHYYGLIRKTIEAQLRYTPGLVTRNRKSLHRPAPFGAAWELRIGPNNRFRVFYDIHTKEQIVAILAVGEKTGNRLRVGFEEYEP